MSDQIERVARAICMEMQQPLRKNSVVQCHCKSLDQISAHCTENVRFARAAIAAASEWLPIESAPKDGTRILLYVPRRVAKTSGPICIGYWNVTKSGEGAWWPYSPPTAWQPLPQPPKVTP